ncbi:MAG: peptidase domain-containing ABC transporter [Victivallales bacterium]|nr:peptidase domain-containing ABC transporter [Victivallales bacterium]
MSADSIQTGFLCLRMLFSRFRRQVNIDALLTEDVRKAYEANAEEALIALASEQALAPEKLADKSALSAVTGPLLAQAVNGTWILLTDARQLQGERTVVYAPTSPDDTRLLSVPSQKVLDNIGDTLLCFRKLAIFDNQQHSRLFAFSAIATHQNSPVDLREVMHQYAVGQEEVSEALFRQIAEDYRFKVKTVKLNWKKLQDSQSVLPCIMHKLNGKFAVLCGFRKKEESVEAVLVDPESEEMKSGQHFTFLSQERFEELGTGTFTLLKKIYKLSDENQPFSLAWFIPEFLKNKGIFFEIAIAVLLLTILSLVTPLFFQIVVDKVLVNQAYNTLNVLGIGMLVAILFNAIVSYARSYLLLFASNKIDIATATRTFAHLMRLPVDFFERVPSGVLLKHMQQNERIRGFLSGNLFFTILDLISLCVFIPFLLFYSATLTAIVLGFSALMALVIASLIKPFQRRLDELYQAEGKRQSMLVESLHGIKTVKSLSLEPVERKAWDDTTAYSIKSYFRVGRISVTAQSLSQMFELMMTICVIWAGAHLVFDNVISVGALIAFQMLAGRVTGPLVKMVGLIHEYQQIALSVKMLGVVMNTPAEPAGGGVRNPIQGRIDFENVQFRYRPDLPNVLRNFTLSLPAGSMLGVVGRSGSGKTTMTRLLQSLYPVTSGLIKIDGIDIREIDKVHLRKNIGVVLQENYFFSGTVRQNISLPKQNASLEEVIYASKLAGADEFVQKLPRGYDTVLEENASNLSGGQRQRLAIARALLTNPPILIFDEATSALDPESEAVVRKNLRAIAKGRTVIIVSHRMSIVSHADRIIVLDHGDMVQQGTHRELLQQEGIYRDFWKEQMRED